MQNVGPIIIVKPQFVYNTLATNANPMQTVSGINIVDILLVETNVLIIARVIANTTRIQLVISVLHKQATQYVPPMQIAPT